MTASDPDRKPGKFSDPRVTVDGSTRASVSPENLTTLWFNTGTLCNIECSHCYIESSPTNDRLAYLAVSEVRAFLDEIEAHRLPVRQIGFTGGEPFMNPAFLEMLEIVLASGLDALVLTNAMRPMMRPHCRDALATLAARYGEALEVRVSLDHYTRKLHESERGSGSFSTTLEGIDWLVSAGVRVSIAGRTRWNDAIAGCKAGYAELFRRHRIPCDANDPRQLVLFPEMDPEADVPEITVDCWEIVGTEPSQMMCSSSRMVVKRNGAAKPSVVACTLLPYEPGFELGKTLVESLRPVALNHPYCSAFCVLGGGSCSV